jgi:hypothetical protein
MQEFGPVAPFRVFRVRLSNPFRITCVPGIFGGLDFLAGGFCSKRREWRARFDLSFHISIVFQSCFQLGHARFEWRNKILNLLDSITRCYELATVSIERDNFDIEQTCAFRTFRTIPTARTSSAAPIASFVGV